MEESKDKEDKGCDNCIYCDEPIDSDLCENCVDNSDWEWRDVEGENIEKRSW